MALVANFAVTSTAALALSSKPATRQLNISNLGAGTLYYQTVPHGAATTLTTSNGTQVTGNPQEFILTPGIDPPSGFDVYLISGTTTTAQIQTVPL